VQEYAGFMPSSHTMKFPGILANILQKNNKPQDRFLTLILDTDNVAAGVWHIADGRPQTTGTASALLAKDDWQERLKVADTLIAQMEDKEGTTALHKTILGLPAQFLTAEGDIAPDARLNIRKLAKVLELELMGFVPIHQALMFYFKQEEGIPPSVIFIGVGNKDITLSLYKIGVLTGQKTVDRNDDVVAHVEQVLKDFKDVEILPSRMFLYGANAPLSEEVRAQLMRNPWQTKANFLHFPKIELLPAETIIRAVSLGGASELGGKVAIVSEEDKELPSQEPLSPLSGSSATAPSPHKTDEVNKQEGKDSLSLEKDEAQEIEETPVESESTAEDKEREEEPNVVMVSPETLGFRKGKDILEERGHIPKTPAPGIGRETEGVLPKEEIRQEIPTETDEVPKRLKISLKLPSIKIPSLPKIAIRLPGIPGGKFKYILAAVLLGILGTIGGALWWFLPHANVTILEIPKHLETTNIITIDPSATQVNGEKDIIPGKKQEKSVSGEKKVAVTGKKTIGDPAKGTVTIFNKTTGPRTFKKGSVLVTGGLQFTLDDDVQAASASENLVSGTVTFGKATGTITASAIGSQSNVPAASEFKFKDLSETVAVARNDTALAGGTSRDVTVVSRADYDGLVKELSGELLEKAKGDLAGSVGGGEKLIDATVKTTVTDKSFGQELDQEATELTGTVTVLVTGISYAEADMGTVMKSILAADVPQGYIIEDTMNSVNVLSMTVKKDGNITANVKWSATALPVIDTGVVAGIIAGKTLSDATQELKKIPGVAGAEFSFRLSPTRNRLPANKKNISVSLSLQE